MPKADKLRSIRASELRRVTANQLRTSDAGDIRDITTEEMEEQCEAPGDLACSNHLKATVRDK